MPQKIYKYYGIYHMYKFHLYNQFIDVISEKDIGLAARWAVKKGYRGYKYYLREISIKRLKALKKRLEREKSEISTRIANISRYV